MLFCDDTLTYLGEKEYKSAIWSCKPFQIEISEIKYIALSPRLVLDDEECFLVFVNKEHKLFKLPYFHTSNISEIIEHFQLKFIQKDYSKYFSYNAHNGKIDKIIYPNKLFLEDLFYKDWKLFTRGLYSWIFAKSFLGNIIDYDN